MPLPSYMLETPSYTPIELLQRRIDRMGAIVDVARVGATVTMRNLDWPMEDHSLAIRAITMACSHADENGLTIEAFVPSVLAGSISAYEKKGFRIMVSTDEEDIHGPHYVLRRPCRH